MPTYYENICKQCGKFYIGRGKIFCGNKCHMNYPESKEKVIKSHTGKKLTKEHKLKISKAHKGNQHWNWRGGKYENLSGYVLVKKHDHPFRNPRNYIFEHRVVMEEKIGRYLKKHEVVHHVNGDKSDNRISNLILTTKKGHSEIHWNEPKYKNHMSIIHMRVPVVPRSMIEEECTNGTKS